MELFYSLTDPRLARVLLAGSVGVLPTDTVYGLVARAADPQAVARLYAIKQREGKPGTLVAANTDQLCALGISAKHVQAVAHLWPNPISIVLPAPPQLDYIHQGKQSLAVRIPECPQLRQLLESTGPLLTSSANLPGQPPANIIRQAQDYFGDKADFYADGGDLSDRSPSTVAHLLPSGDIEVIRQGSVTIA